MRKEKIYQTTKLAVLSLAMIASACQYKDLDDYQYENGLTVHVDNAKVGSEPSEYRIAFYEHNASGYTSPIMYDIRNHERVYLPIGAYNVTLWNKDTPHVKTDGYNNRNTAYATTGAYQTTEAYYNPYSLVDSLFEQPVMDFPDYMVHASLENVLVDTENNQQITMQTDSMMVALSITVHGVSGLNIVKRCKGALNNVSGARRLHNSTTRATSPVSEQDSVTVVFSCDFNERDSTVTAAFNVFGLFPGDTPESLQHRMALMFWTDYGNVYVVQDISDDVLNAAKRSTSTSKIVINIPPIDLDISKTLDLEKSLFDTDVTNWQGGGNTNLSM